MQGSEFLVNIITINAQISDYLKCGCGRNKKLLFPYTNQLPKYATHSTVSLKVIY